MARDVRTTLAHAFGRVADIVRGNSPSTAIEREEVQVARRAELDRQWNRAMFEYQRKQERALPRRSRPSGSGAFSDSEIKRGYKVKR